MIAEAEVTRRSFLKLAGGAGAVFVLGSFTSIACAGSHSEAAPFEPNAFVSIDRDGTVSITICKSDMGQGVRTSFAMMAADEMDADWSKVKAVNATGNDRLYGGQMTGGSSSTTGSGYKYRQLGAAARVMLIGAAAQKWGVDPSTCTTSNGQVLHAASGRSADYGSLTAEAAAQPIPSGQIALKDPSQFKIIGKPTNRVDNLLVVTGKAQYGIDVRLDGMLIAVIARPPALGQFAQSFDDTEVRKIDGVTEVLKCGVGVAVVAKNTWAAIKGREALKVTWSPNPSVGQSTNSFSSQLHAAAIANPEPPAGARVIEATYEMPYLAHVTMEPLNAVADVRADRATVWVGAQGPDGVRKATASQLGLPEDAVTVNLMLLGGGFGRRAINDFTADAVNLSKGLGAPVKVIWTREDDVRHDFYRPMNIQVLQGALDTTGTPVAWSHQFIQTDPGRDGGGDFQGRRISYNIPDAVMRHASVRTPVQIGQWRSVEFGMENFGVECFIDELAHAAGADPYEFRLKLANDTCKRVLQAVAEHGGWGQKLPAGSGRGIALFQGYSGACAHVIEVKVVGKKIKVTKAVAVVDCGLCINPKTVEAQIMGATSDGIAIALTAGIHHKDGVVVESNFDDFVWTAMNTIPKVEVIILPGGPNPGGMGELGVPSVAPAIANAVFAATGQRARKLPIVLDGMV